VKYRVPDLVIILYALYETAMTGMDACALTDHSSLLRHTLAPARSTSSALKKFKDDSVAITSTLTRRCW
jgi:hypothetical protein